MEDETQYYKKLDLDRERFLHMGYTINGIPVNNKHQARLERKEKEKRDAAEANERAEQECESLKAKGQAREAHYSQASSNYASSNYTSSNYTRPSRTNTSSTSETGKSSSPLRVERPFDDTEYSIPFEENNGMGQILPLNVWPVLLTFGDHALPFEGKVLLDSGAEDNWIAEKVVRNNGIPWDDAEDDDEFLDFNGRTVKASGVVRADWVHNHKRVTVKFKIAPHAPWEVLFGYRHMLKENILTFSNGKRDKFVAPLIKNTRKPGPSKSTPSRKVARRLCITNSVDMELNQPRFSGARKRSKQRPSRLSNISNGGRRWSMTAGYGRRSRATSTEWRVVGSSGASMAIKSISRLPWTETKEICGLSRGAEVPRCLQVCTFHLDNFHHSESYLTAVISNPLQLSTAYCLIFPPFSNPQNLTPAPFPPHLNAVVQHSDTSYNYIVALGARARQRRATHISASSSTCRGSHDIEKRRTLRASPDNTSMTPHSI
jgi:hypothetical protein